MKKNFVVLAALACGLSACVATDGSLATGQTASTATYGAAAQQIGMTAIKVAINAKCTTELSQVPAWKTMSKALSTEQQQTAQSNICGCVSEKGPENVTAVDLATAAIDPAARTTIVSNAVTRTLNQCMTAALK